MPSPYVKKLSQETGKSEKEIEKLWKKAKEIASEEFGKPEDDFGSKEFAYVTGVIKNMLGIDENILDPSKFLESDYSAKDYIETVISGNFSIGNVIPPEEDEEDEEEITEEDLDVEETDNYQYEWLANEHQNLEKEALIKEDVDEELVNQLDKIIEEDLN